MRKYDFIFSLGFSCGVSQALRAAGLQYASYPLDWTGSAGVVASARLVAEDFKGWFEKEDFELVDVRHGAGFCTRAYVNRRTQLGYSHEFSDFEPFDRTFPQVKAIYSRRVARFIEVMASAKTILAVYMECPTRGRVPEAELAEARRLIAARYPGATVELCYVYAEPGVVKPEQRSSADGVTVLAYDYRKFDEGEVSHFVEFGPLAEYLAASCSAVDTRNETEKKEYAVLKSVGSKRWGPDKSGFRRWLNKMAYKTYRELERILIRKGLVQREGPLWFWKQ